METILLPQKKCDVILETDVIVVGGGPGGIGASVAAAREGVDVVLIDDNACLGGSVTKQLLTFTESALEVSGDKILVQGIWQIMIEKMASKGKAIRGYDFKKSHKYYPFDTSRCEKDKQLTIWDLEALKLTAEDMMREFGVHVRMYTKVIDVIKDNDRVTGVVIDSMEGIQIIKAKRFIDATGNATLMRCAGVEYDTPYGKDGGNGGPVTIYMRCGGIKNVTPSYKPNMKEIPYGAVCFFPMMREGEFRVEMTRAIGNGLKVESLTKATMEARSQVPWLLEWLRNNWPGCEDIYLIDSSPAPSIFTFPKIMGMKRLQTEDIINCIMPDDRIALCGYGVDIWPKEVGGQNYTHFLEPGEHYGISYYCLIPKQPVENLIAAGKIVSYEEGTETGGMQTPPSMATGEAAGIAAALSIKENVTPRELDYKKVQSCLIKRGAIIDPIPVPEVEGFPVYEFTY